MTFRHVKLEEDDIYMEHLHRRSQENIVIMHIELKQAWSGGEGKYIYNIV